MWCPLPQKAKRAGADGEAAEAEKEAEGGAGHGKKSKGEASVKEGGPPKKRRDARAISDVTLTAGAVGEADAKVASLKAANPLYASLFTSSRPALSGDDERKGLFIRTSTALYTQNRG